MEESNKKLWRRIKNKDFTAIAKNVGIIPDFNTLISALSPNIILEELKGAEKEWNEAVASRDIDRIERVFKKCKDFINIDAYILLAYQLIENGAFSIDKKGGNIFLQYNYYAKMFEDERIEVKKRLEDFIPECDAIVGQIRYNAETHKLIPLNCTRTAMRSIERNRQRIEEIKKVISIDELIRKFGIAEIKTIMNNESIVNKIYDIIKNSPKGVFDKKSENVVNVMSYDIELLQGILAANIELCDLDNLLMVGNLFNFTAFQNNPSQENFEELEKFYNATVPFIENKELKLNYIDSNYMRRKFDYNELEKFKKFFEACLINGKYCNKDEFFAIACDIRDGKLPYNYITPKTYSFFHYNKSEFSQIFMHDVNSIKFFLENNIITRRDAASMLDDLKKRLIERENGGEEGKDNKEKLMFNYDTTTFLLEQGLLNIDSLLDLYIQGSVPIESFFMLNKENEKQLTGLFSANALAKLYMSFKEGKDTEKYKRFAKLYSSMIMNQNDYETKNELSEHLLEEIGDFAFEDENLFELYRDGVLSCDVVTSFAGLPAIRELYTSGEMKPSDARRLFEDGVITMDLLKDLFESKDIEDEKKIALIFSTFSEDEDAEIRDELLTYLPNTRASIARKKHSNTEPPTIPIPDPEPEPPTTPSKTFLINPAKRWNFMSAWDTDYTQEYCDDGHIIFKLPNLGVYMIEKIFASGSKDNFATGAASYFVDEEFFDEHSDEIIIKNKGRTGGKETKCVNRHALVTFEKDEKEQNVEKTDKKIYRITHGGKWAKKVCTLFGLYDDGVPSHFARFGRIGRSVGIYKDNDESVYSKEDRERIEKLAIETDKSKTLYVKNGEVYMLE